MTSTVRTEASPGAIATTLEAIEAHWHPTQSCYYGVRHGQVQAYGRGPDQFYETLIDPVDEEFLPSPSTERQLNPYHVGSCCWPTEFGWAILEASRSDYSDESTFNLKVCLLSLGPLIRPGPVETVFETLGESLPQVQTMWPLRKLIIKGDRQTLDRIEPVTEATFGTPGEFHQLRCHGTNPLYGTRAEDLPTPPTTLKVHVYRPLSKVSTLMYNPEPDGPDRECELGSLMLVDPPLQNTLFVTGTLRRAT
ncbi:hypothetical protein BV210_04835 [Halorientalis sp. IM1011]|nr:hypothetical protein BV210_04835 [Halorientalis sp. IM1011]